MKISRKLFDDLVDHARQEAPNECCGIIAARDGVAVELRRATNAQASPLRFEITGPDLLWTWEIEDRGLDLVIYHSHTRTAPEPSQTDIAFAAEWPQALWLIVGIKNDVPDLRLWRVRDAKISEEQLVVSDA